LGLVAGRWELLPDGQELGQGAGSQKLGTFTGRLCLPQIKERTLGQDQPKSASIIASAEVHGRFATVRDALDHWHKLEPSDQESAFLSLQDGLVFQPSEVAALKVQS
jgi:hypothetical protein